MKFRVPHEEFAESVAWVARSLPSRPPVPVLGGVLLTAGDDGLTVSGFDYEVSARVRVAAEVADEGEGRRGGRGSVVHRASFALNRSSPATTVSI